MTADEGIAALRRIRTDFSAFCAARGSVSEADTRAKVVDAVLKDVLGWPEAEISREDHVERGFIDYTITVQSKPFIVVEAKREGVPFVFPAGDGHRTLKLSGSILTEPAIREAILQVRGYCDDGGIRYAIATNGYAWILFRAIREDSPWKSGHARVFRGLDEVEEQFTSFWNLLSREAVYRGALDAEFGSPYQVPRQLHRPLDHIFNSDLPLQRNRLHAQLHGLISTIFDDIADQDQVEILKECYVHSGSLRIAAKDIDCVITDEIPKFLLDEGVRSIRQEADDAGRFGRAVALAVGSNRGQLFLLLGGIGSGKTTFLKRYQRTVGRDALDGHALWFHVDFLAAPLDPLKMEEFVWRTVLEQLRGRYASPFLETRRNIKAAFAGDLRALEGTALKGLQSGTDEYEEAITPFLSRWQENVSEYVPRLLRHCKPRKELQIVLFVDNVDQLSPEYQSSVFVLAQRVTRAVAAITIVAMREESYYAASVQRIFTAYSNRKFHIASPRFRKLIGNRIDYALRLLERENDGSAVAQDGELDRVAIASFLRIVQISIFQFNRNIARFIEAICFGNMRKALQMFATFLVSGATDVDKMLRIYGRHKEYFVAFHEFVKSIMLGDRRYYKEEASPVMNVFDCGADRNASHFTALRILAFLLARRGESVREGQGYVEVAKVVWTFEDLLDNREDVIRGLTRLVERQLVETNTRAPDLKGASHVRVTSAGWYYYRHLASSFCYLDLVLQDTPVDSYPLAKALGDAVFRVDNLADREDEKLHRMEVRFSRVEMFLDYLADQERAELDRGGVAFRESDIGVRLTDGLREKYHIERDRIRTRLAENQERYAEELLIVAAEEEEAVLGEVYDDDETIEETLEASASADGREP